MSTARVRCRLAAAAIAVLATAAEARLVPCHQPADAIRIAGAIDRMRQSVDPCGESAEVAALLERLDRCPAARYEICIDAAATRNFLTPRGAGDSGSITWNPELRSELEAGCDGDPARPVIRDPVASLLHELVHAVDDCEGRNPGTRELEAVRIENIYRRSAGLCQRSAYGDDRLVGLPQPCTSGTCACPVLFAAPVPGTEPTQADAAGAPEIADSARTGSELGGEPVPARSDVP